MEFDSIVPSISSFDPRRSTKTGMTVPSSPADDAFSSLSLLELAELGAGDVSFADLTAALFQTGKQPQEPTTPGLVDVAWLEEIIQDTAPALSPSPSPSPAGPAVTGGPRPKRVRQLKAAESSPERDEDDEDEDDESSGEPDGTTPLPVFNGPLPESYWQLEEWQIASISFKDFYKLMAKSRLSSKEVDQQKKLRRRVKNRYSARSCSSRKKGKMSSTEGENQALKDQVSELDRLNSVLSSQHMLLQERFIELQKAAAESQREKIFLRAEIDRVRELARLANVSDSMGSGFNGRAPDFAGAA